MREGVIFGRQAIFFPLSPCGRGGVPALLVVDHTRIGISTYSAPLFSLSCTSVGQPQHRDFAFDLGGDVEQIARVEADIERVGGVFDFELFGGAAGIRVGHRQHQLAVGQRQLYGAAAFARNGRDAVDRGLKVLLVDDQFLVVVLRNDAAVI